MGGDDGSEGGIETVISSLGKNVKIVEEAEDDVKLTPNNFSFLKTLEITSLYKLVKVHYNFDAQNDRFFTMKIKKKSKLKTEKDVEHSENEVRILKKISHQFLSSLYFSFQTERKLYVVTDYCCGGSLRFHILNSVEQFSNIWTVKFYLVQILSAVKYLHDQNIIHRSLFPESISLLPDGYIKLTDFSLSKQNTSNLTDCFTSTFCGIPEYMAPEILQGKNYGKAADVWSLGILTYEMLYGYPPFMDADVSKLCKKIIFNQVRFEPKDDKSRRFVPDLHLNAVKFVGKMLAKEASERPGVGELLEDEFFNNVDISAIINKKIDVTNIPIIPKKNENFYIEKR